MQKFANLKVLNFEDSEYLTHIPDVSGLSNLEEFSTKSCKNLLTIHNSIGYLNKLKDLNAEECSQLRSFPPLKLPFLKKLQLSGCKRLKSFPEILGEMQNVTVIQFYATSIEEFTLSFQNLTRLWLLLVEGNGIHRLSSSILMMPNLWSVHASNCHLLLPTQNDTEMSSKLKSLELHNCSMLDEFLPEVLTLLTNLTLLDLSRNYFTVLPECLKECRSLYNLCLDDCKFLREIRGIPLNLKLLSAKRCVSLTPASKSILLNQVFFRSI
jgi:Leucine-rich repeat (LRR) protein